MQPAKSNTNTLLESPSKIIMKLSLSFVFVFLSLLSYTNSSIAAEAKTIAITEIVEHPSLSQAKQGIIDELRDSGYEEGKNLTIIDKNAQGAIANAMLIAKKFVQLKPDAIIPISTPSAQSTIKAASGTDIPVVFSSVTDPVAAGLILDMEKAKKNITGAIDYPLIQEEIDLIKHYIPNVKTIGFLYSTGEANSVKTIDLMKEAIEGKIDYIDSQVASSHQVSQAIESLIGKVDAIYIPSDNVVYSAMPKLVQMSRKYKLPVFSSDPDSVKSGVLACIGYTQYEVGRTAGKLLVQVFNGERNLKVQKPAKAQIFINAKTAKIMGFETPEEILGVKTDIVGLK
ncbi:MAG: ABC transporter substrate-binding protein [Pseudomonadota bacterium]